MTELIKNLVSETGLSSRDILRIVENAPRKYATFTIPKRSGGERTISQPARELKAVQRALHKIYLTDLPIHSTAMAYRKKLSIRDNAIRHAHNNPILKFDFSDFFPSIKPRDWHTYCDMHGIFTDTIERHQTTQILFHSPGGIRQLRLAIGAPTSPHLSNLLMYEFDSQISAIVAKDSVTYTRYADDLTFSAKRTGFLVNVERQLRDVIRKIEVPKGLKLNEKKTVLATNRYHRQVTGLILTNDCQVSIGRSRKRKLSSSVHHYITGKLDQDEIKRLSGMLAFVYAVEPDFINRLRDKYGSDCIDALKHVPAT